jgi:hypothetical protein
MDTQSVVTRFSLALALTMSVAAVAAAQGTNPPGLCKAGITGFAVGQAGITVNFPVAWPANVVYAMSVQPTNTSGYSPTTVCTYFNVLNKTATSFQVQHKRCDNGVPVALDAAITLDWIACPRQ